MSSRRVCYPTFAARHHGYKTQDTNLDTWIQNSGYKTQWEKFTEELLHRNNNIYSGILKLIKLHFI